MRKLSRTAVAGALFALPLLLCLLTLGAGNADARRRCCPKLDYVKVVNGGDVPTTVMRMDVARGDGSRTALHLLGVRNGRSAVWRPRTLVGAKAVNTRLCVPGEESEVTLGYSFPARGTDRKLLGTGSIRRVIVSVGRQPGGLPSAQAKFELSNGKFAIRALERVKAHPDDCKRWLIMALRGVGGGQGEANWVTHPFVRIRLKNGSGKKAKAVQVNAHHKTDDGTKTLAGKHVISAPPEPQHGYTAPGASSPPDNSFEANYVEMCVMVGRVSYFATFYAGSTCKIEDVDFEINAKDQVRAHVHVYPEQGCTETTTVTLEQVACSLTD